ncbi:hypothetical protein COCVIDRAFT_115931, partial [Bipolaris victoriae FI3]
YTKSARRFNVSRRTLVRPHQGLSTSRTIRYQNQQALHPEQEIKLTEYIDPLSVSGTEPNRNLVQSFAAEIAQKEISYH